MSSTVTPVLTVIGLFQLGLVSPGPNFFIVVTSTLNCGRRAGIITGLGVAMGDVIYASAGLFGISTLMDRRGYILFFIKACGGFYLAWLGLRMVVKRRRFSNWQVLKVEAMPRRRLLLRGLASDLSNPKTVAFFASIFAFAVHSDTPRAARLAMLLGIFMTSVLWRAFVSIVFSTSLVLASYQRFQRLLETIFGASLCLLGLRLAEEAFLQIPRKIAGPALLHTLQNMNP